MRFGVRVFATLTKYFPSALLGQVIEVELDEGGTLGDLFKEASIPDHEVKITLRNGKPCTLSQAPEEGPSFILLLLMAGG